jgi:hypothetical protein
VEDGRQEPDLETAHGEEVEGAAPGERVGEGWIQVDPVPEEERHRERLEGGPEAGRHPLAEVAFEQGETWGPPLPRRARPGI